MADYIHLLGHLHRPSSSSLPLDAINAAIAHHLARITPYPTPLAAAVVSSPLFYPFSHTKLQGLTTAFRHASHIKYKALHDDKGTIFTRSNSTRFRQWIFAVVKGLQGGEPIIRLACCGGVLLALHDLDPKSLPGDGPHRSRIEDELVVGLAEIMDKYSYKLSPGAWEREFHFTSDGQEVDALSLALILASQYLPHVFEDKLKALPLRAFARLLISTIDNAFSSGSFLSSLSPSITIKSSVLHIPETAPFTQSIQATSSSLLISSVAPLSKLCARTLSLLLDSKPEEGIAAVEEMLQTLWTLTSKVEIHWDASPIADITDMDKIAPDTRPITEKIWMILKTLLFSTVMITDACLLAFVYIPAHIARRPFISPAPFGSNSAKTPASSLAQATLQILSHLSFVISQFGGVTSTSEGGFTELKRVFYLALDILAVDKEASERLVRQLCQSFDCSGSSSGTISIQSSVLCQNKKAYSLAIIEQLVPVISAKCIELQVLPLCMPHLSDSAHRETYESSHSVVLTAFSSHAQQVGEHNLDTDRISLKGKGPDKGESRPLAFTDRLVPFYTNCLIENSTDGKLSTPQLRLAFSALVRSASASANVADVPSLANDRYTLAWFCIESLLDRIHSLSDSAKAATAEQSHRLHLVLISTIPSLPLTLLPRILSEVRQIIVGHPDGWRKKELIQALFDELLGKVAEREKEFSMRWWYDNRMTLGWSELDDSTPVPDPPSSSLSPRL